MNNAVVLAACLLKGVAMNRKSIRRFLRKKDPRPDRDMSGFAEEFPQEPQVASWGEAQARALLTAPHYMECELIGSRPVRDYADRNTTGKGLSHGR